MNTFIKQNWIFIVVIGFAIIAVVLAKNSDAPVTARNSNTNTALLGESLGAFEGGNTLPGKTYDVKLYYNNSLLGPLLRCDEVFPVQRTLGVENLSAADTLSILLAGPTEAEQYEGYFTSLSPGVRVHNFAIENGQAIANFTSDIVYNIPAGSCRAEAVRAQIESTLMQFPDVQSVAITVNGSTENIFTR